jgi:hypothetical protein
MHCRMNIWSSFFYWKATISVFTLFSVTPYVLHVAVDLSVCVVYIFIWLSLQCSEWNGWYSSFVRRTHSVIRMSPCSTKLLQWRMIRITVCWPDWTGPDWTELAPCAPGSLLYRSCEVDMCFSNHGHALSWHTRVIPPHSLSGAQIFAAL